MTWDSVPIGSVINSTQYGLSVLADSDGDLPIVGMKDIQAGRVNFDPSVCVRLSDEKAKCYLLSDGDILLNRTNSPDLVGKAGIYRGTDRVVFASYLVRLELKRDLADPDFVIQILNSDFGQRRIKKLATRAISQANLNPTTFKNHFYIPLPKIREQEAIRDVLLLWDVAIEKTEKLIATKERQFRHLSYDLLFGRRRLNGRATKGFLSKPWFSVPDDWEIVIIDAVANEISMKNQNGDNIPVLSCTKYDGLVDSLKYFDKQIFSKDTSTYKVVEYGQFAYATNHIEEGSIGYQNLYPKGLVSPMYTVFRADQQQINDGYLYKLLKTETYRHIFEINTSASVDRRGSLRWNAFSKLPVPLPLLEEQEEINSVLDSARKEIDLLKKQVEAYRKQKRGLMQKLLTGEWRVKPSGEVP